MTSTIKPLESADVWERFIRAYSPGALFQSYSWGEVEKKRGSTIWRFGAYSGKDLVGIFQVLKVTAKRGTFLHVRHGPILISQNEAPSTLRSGYLLPTLRRERNPSEAKTSSLSSSGLRPRYFAKGDKSQWALIVSFLKDLARKENAWFVRISPQIEDSEHNQRLLESFGMHPAPIHAMDGEFCWVLDLAPSEEQLLVNMRKTTRYEIRRAQKLGVTVRKSKDPLDLDAFFSLYKETSKRHGFVPHTGIEEEFKEFLKENRTILLLGSFKKQVLGAAIILFYNTQVIYHHSASIPTSIPVNYAIQWEAILEAKKRGAEVYNFWGIAPEDKPDHPWRGITLFKKGFGGREIRFIHAHDLLISPLYAIPRTIEMGRRVLKGY